MAFRLDSLFVDVGVEGVAKANADLASFGRQFQATFSDIARIFATGAAAAAVRELVTLGTTVEETGSKFAAVFGPAASRVDEFSKSLGTAAGLSRQQFQELTASTGVFVQGLGFAQDASAELAVQVQKVAADIASFSNVQGGAAEVTRAITALFAGEGESIKRLVGPIREADIQQRALADSGKASAKELTQQERVTAALALVTDRAGVAIGDLERTQDSLANQLRRVNAAFQDLRNLAGVQLVAAIGQLGNVGDQATSTFDVFRVVIEKVGTAIRATVAAFQILGPAAAVAVQAVQSFFQAITPGGVTAGQAFDNLQFTIQGAKETIDEIFDAFNIAEVRARDLAGGVNTAATAMENLSTSGKKAADGVKEVIATVGGSSGINDVFQELTESLQLATALQETFGNQVGRQGLQIQAYKDAIVGLLKEGLQPSDPAVRSLVDAMNQLETSTKAATLAAQVALGNFFGALGESTKKTTEQLKETAALGVKVGQDFGNVIVGAVDEATKSLERLGNTATRIFARLGIEIAKFAISYGLNAAFPGSGLVGGLTRALGYGSLSGSAAAYSAVTAGGASALGGSGSIFSGVKLGSGNDTVVNLQVVAAGSHEVIETISYRQRRDAELDRPVLIPTRSLGFVGG